MSQFRASQVYIQNATRRQLIAIAQAFGRDVTVDEIADGMLRDAIGEKYPEVAALQKKIDAIEGEMVKAVTA